jgi:hypothetical protein
LLRKRIIRSFGAVSLKAEVLNRQSRAFATKTNDIASSFEFHVIACEFIFCA